MPFEQEIPSSQHSLLVGTHPSAGSPSHRSQFPLGTWWILIFPQTSPQLGLWSSWARMDRRWMHGLDSFGAQGSFVRLGASSYWSVRWHQKREKVDWTLKGRNSSRSSFVRCSGMVTVTDPLPGSVNVDMLNREWGTRLGRRCLVIRLALLIMWPLEKK